MFKIDIAKLEAHIPLGRGDVIVSVVQAEDGPIAISENGFIYHLRLRKPSRAVTVPLVVEPGG